MQSVSLLQLSLSRSQVLNGHFVHYFAPKDLPVVPKNVVFVIDTSASMLGTKLRQVKQPLFIVWSQIYGRFMHEKLHNEVMVCVLCVMPLNYPLGTNKVLLIELD